MTLEKAALVSAFKKNYCVAAYPGAIEIGEVENEHFCFKEKKSIIVPQKKIEEFFLLLETLGRNIAVEGQNENYETSTFEVGVDNIISLEKCQMTQLFKKKENFVLNFDEFVYIDFLAAISHVLLFVTMPTKEQFFIMKKFANLPNDGLSQTKIETVTMQIADSSPRKIFMLAQFLAINISVIEVFVKILRILGK